MESEIPEKGCGVRLGVKEQVVIASFCLISDQMGEDPVQKSLAPVAGADREAAQGIPAAAAGGDGAALGIIHGAGVIQVFVAPEPLMLQQPIHRFHACKVAGQHLSDIEFVHSAASLRK